MVHCMKCGHRDGERLCIELGDWLCPECCGQYRIVDINCWVYCPFFFGEEVSSHSTEKKE